MALSEGAFIIYRSLLLSFQINITYVALKQPHHRSRQPRPRPPLTSSAGASSPCNSNITICCPSCSTRTWPTAALRSSAAWRPPPLLLIPSPSPRPLSPPRRGPLLCWQRIAVRSSEAIGAHHGTRLQSPASIHCIDMSRSPLHPLTPHSYPYSRARTQACHTNAHMHRA